MNKRKSIPKSSLVLAVTMATTLCMSACSKTVDSGQHAVWQEQETEAEQSQTSWEEMLEEETLQTETLLEEMTQEETQQEETAQKQTQTTTNKKIQKEKSEKKEEMKEVIKIEEEQVPQDENINGKDEKNKNVSQKQETDFSNQQADESDQNTEENDTDEKNDVVQKPDESQINTEYKLVWEDDFNATELNRDDWNVELHEPGWVNQEWQEYVDSEENIYLQDGNLIIQAVKATKDGKDYYTSGRVNTQNKHDYKYGKFEVRAKVPSGKGFLPAFWMMPTDENVYGQWPKCGEIDIMEVLGDKTDTAHGTLHYGEPHTQKQGTYQLDKGDFSSEYHVYACEWEPGEIRFYVDGELYFTQNDWFTKREEFGEVTYPAPFDQPFYMILNVAVGGSWVGYPDESTKFDENARMVVDYVRVYQKDSYDENVEKPEHNVVLREPDSTGNYINNSDFSQSESMEDGQDWEFLTALGGLGKADIADGQLCIETQNAGTADYSIQIVQAGVPLEKGWKYRLSFDAYAAEERTMITDVSAPDLNYTRYLNDMQLNLTTEMQRFEFEFDMTADSDANGRVEFNLGNQNSKATVYIDNVRVEKVEEIAITENQKTVLPDGNYVYNGQFNEGSNRLSYWEVKNACDGANIYVTNENLNREFVAEVPVNVNNREDIILKQTDIALSGGKTYKFTLDAYGNQAQEIEARIAGQTFTIALTEDKKTYTFVLETGENVKASDLEFLLGTAGTIHLDNVRIQEDGMIVNGDFVNGTVGYEIYINESAKVSYGVDELTENASMGFTIEDTGSQDWMIQLKQNNIKLEQGKWYKLTFEAKSDLDRTIMYALQRDGSSDDNWIPYSGTQKIQVSSDYEKYEHIFKMKNDTDAQTILSISMGAVNDERITQKHTIYIDNIVLEETQQPQQPENTKGDLLIKNGDFSKGMENWENAITNPAAATLDTEEGKVVYHIENVGDEEWHIQLKQSGITLEQGKTYELTLKLKSDESRTVKAALLTQTYDWYGGADIELEKDEMMEMQTSVYVEKETDTDITFVLSMGVIADKDTPASNIEIYQIGLKEIEE